MDSRSQGRAWDRTQTSHLPDPGSLPLSHHRQSPTSPSASQVRGGAGLEVGGWVSD